MNFETTYQSLDNVDIYIIDQILKDRYGQDRIILDAGCGKGRNLKWFYLNKYQIHGIDMDKEFLAFAKGDYPKQAHNFIAGTIDNLPYKESSFDHILCCAVLHFATSETHFTQMFEELIRVLTPGGMLHIRMASNIGLDGNAPEVTYKENGQKGTYYLSRERIHALLNDYHITLLEPIKTTNVQDERAMTTLVLTTLA